MDVSLIQCELKQVVSPIVRTGVVSDIAKFVALKVISVIPDAGALSRVSLVTAGALYVKNVAPVP